MKNEARNEELMTRYLLGELPEAEQLRLEERFFTDEEFSEQLLALENELKYDYAWGALTPQARAQFERRFLATDEDCKEVEFAGAVMSKVAEVAGQGRPKPIADEGESRVWLRSLLAFFSLQNPAMRISFAAGGLVVAFGLLWLIFETVRLRDELEHSQAQRASQEESLRRQADDERNRRQELSDELERERSQRVQLEEKLARQQPPSQARYRHVTPDQSSRLLIAQSFVLTAGIVRDNAEPKRLFISPDTGLLKLQLEPKPLAESGAGSAVVTVAPTAPPTGPVPQRLRLKLKTKDEYRSYRVVVRTADGEELLSQDLPRIKRTASGQPLVLTLPAVLFDEGDYELTLKGLAANRKFEDVADYYFTIVKK